MLAETWALALKTAEERLRFWRVSSGNPEDEKTLTYDLALPPAMTKSQEFKDFVFILARAAIPLETMTNSKESIWPVLRLRVRSMVEDLGDFMGSFADVASTKAGESALTWRPNMERELKEKLQDFKSLKARKRTRDEQDQESSGEESFPTTQAQEKKNKSTSPSIDLRIKVINKIDLGSDEDISRFVKTHAGYLVLVNSVTTAPLLSIREKLSAFGFKTDIWNVVGPREYTIYYKTSRWDSPFPYDSEFMKLNLLDSEWNFGEDDEGTLFSSEEERDAFWKAWDRAVKEMPLVNLEVKAFDMDSPVKELSYEIAPRQIFRVQTSFLAAMIPEKADVSLASRTDKSNAVPCFSETQ